MLQVARVSVFTNVQASGSWHRWIFGAQQWRYEDQAMVSYADIIVLVRIARELGRWWILKKCWDTGVELGELRVFFSLHDWILVLACVLPGTQWINNHHLVLNFLREFFLCAAKWADLYFRFVKSELGWNINLQLWAIGTLIKISERIDIDLGLVLLGILFFLSASVSDTSLFTWDVLFEITEHLCSIFPRTPRVYRAILLRLDLYFELARTSLDDSKILVKNNLLFSLDFLLGYRFILPVTVTISRYHLSNVHSRFLLQDDLILFFQWLQYCLREIHLFVPLFTYTLHRDVIWKIDLPRALTHFLSFTLCSLDLLPLTELEIDWLNLPHWVASLHALSEVDVARKNQLVQLLSHLWTYSATRSGLMYVIRSIRHNHDICVLNIFKLWGRIKDFCLFIAWCRNLKLQAGNIWHRKSGVLLSLK